MATAFQANAFQFRAFQIDGNELGSRDVGGAIVRGRFEGGRWIPHGQYSRRDWERQKKRKHDEYVVAEKVANAKRGQEHKEYQERVASGETEFHALIRQLEQQQSQRAKAQAFAFVTDAASRLSAIQKFQQAALKEQRMAELRQFIRDSEEEEEALEILMQDE